MNRTTRQIFAAAAALGGLAVIIGAFGAHALKPQLLTSGRLEVFETGVRYHFYHALALLFSAIVHLHLHYKSVVYAAICFVLGTLLFSGSLYLISVWSELSFLGPITPLGGLLLVIGWALLLISALKVPAKM